MSAPRAAIFILLIAAAAHGQGAAPTTRVPNCTTGECHASETRYPFLHGPVAAGACEVCHVATDESHHQFEMKHTGAEMCDFCHIGKSDRLGLNVHEPVARGQCTECHNPHGSSVRMMLRGESTAAVCRSCHQEVGQAAHVHAPVAGGDCLACHRAHSSTLADLLVKDGRSLCLGCHANVLEPKQAAVHAVAAPPPAAGAKPAPALARGAPAMEPRSEPAPATAPAPAAPAESPHRPPMVHDPALGDCLQCHKPHDSAQPALLDRPAVELCGSCHQAVAEAVLTAPVAHAVVTDARACLNCHAPHASYNDHLLSAAPLDLCLDCHARDLKRPDGSVVSSVADLARADYHRHAPVDESGCQACHDVHGGPFNDLLRRPFSPSFYQRFDPQAYGLCLECHDQRAFTEARTTSLTGFRDGDRNLHYVHVTGSGDSGRNCRVCHATHAAASSKLLRPEASFGQWQIPINFEQTATGGSCAAGCHRARRYDRGPPAAPQDPAPADPDAP